MRIRVFARVILGLCLSTPITIRLLAEDAPPTSPAKFASAMGPDVEPAADLAAFTREQRMEQFVADSFSPSALAFVALGAAYDQKTDYPGAWPQGADGYGRRVASNFSQRAIGNAIQLGVESLLSEDSRHVPTGRQGLLPRVGAKFAQSLGVRTPSGNRSIPVGQIAGTFGAGFLSRAWHPREIGRAHV